MCLELIPTFPQPAVPGVEVVLQDRVDSVVGHLCGVLLDGSPAVRHVPVGVIDGFGARERLRSCQENCTRPCEGLHVVGHITEIGRAHV